MVMPLERALESLDTVQLPHTNVSGCAAFWQAIVLAGACTSYETSRTSVREVFCGREIDFQGKCRRGDWLNALASEPLLI